MQENLVWWVMVMRTVSHAASGLHRRLGSGERLMTLDAQSPELPF
jgi:hypothetical protein